MDVFIFQVPINAAMMGHNQKKDENEERRKQLLQTRQMMEELEDWESVSEIQYELDQLPPPPKPEPKLEPWFIAAFLEFFVKKLRSRLAQDIYMMKTVQRFDDMIEEKK